MSRDLAAEGWTTRQMGGFGQLVGPLWGRAEGAGWVVGLLVEERHLNKGGIMHGGMLCTLADSALAMVAWEGAKRRPIATIQLNVHFVDSAKKDDLLEGRCEVVRATRSLVFVRGRFSVGERTVGMADGIWKILGDTPLPPEALG